MPILATGTTDLIQRSKCHTQQGFTLIEILVVVIIIGIMMTTVVALRGSGQESRYLQSQAQRIQMVVALAQQQAVYTGLPLQMQFSNKGYEFFAWQLQSSPSEVDPAKASNAADPEGTANVLAEQPEGAWQKIEIDALKTYEPERPVTFSLRFMDQNHSRNQATVAETSEPAVYFYPDGLMTAVEMALVLPDWPDKQIKMSSDGFSPLVFELIEVKP